MTVVFNKATSKKRRRDLRHVPTAPEILVWSVLRNRQLEGYKFKRQFSIDHYVVDFYCPAAQLVIEIDGDSHFTPEGKLYDKQREDYLKALNLKILRFTNEEVMKNLAGVIDTIKQVILTSPHPSPS